jgi:hypothetical protein
MSMIFGWRPNTSCYKQSATELQQAQQANATPTCAPTPTWWYLAIAAAAFLGVSKK